MGRPLTWDEPTVLRAARGLFRRKGHANTSLRDVEEATGLHPGSLYKRFGSKDGLFAAALSSYNDLVVRRRVAEHLEREDDPLAGIRSFFTSLFDAAPGIEPEHGCLLTNTAIESCTLDPGLRTGVTDGLALVEQGFAGAVRRAVASRQLPRSTDVEAVAAQLLALNQGVLVLVKLGTPATKLAALANGAVDSITGHPSRGARR